MGTMLVDLTVLIISSCCYVPRLLTGTSIALSLSRGELESQQMAIDSRWKRDVELAAVTRWNERIPAAASAFAPRMEDPCDIAGFISVPG